MLTHSRPVVGRFAPSPTGPLHLGSLVAAVGSYVLAKRLDGQWLVRMEDLDTPRVVPGMADDIPRTLELLGFCWDGEIVRQSSRTGAYQAAFDQLVAAGQVYPCGCSRAEIARVATAPHDGEGELVYPGSCRSGLLPGKAPRSYRVRVPDERFSFLDGIQGEVTCGLPELCGDFVVRRADGLFAYQLAVVVDDAAQGVNQVVRGADLLSSTPRQILLQRLLGFESPSYAHLPLIVNPDGGKLSKRDTTVSLAQDDSLVSHGWQLLGAALQCLGSQLPRELAGAPGRFILDWAVGHLAAESIPRGPVPAPRDESPGPARHSS
jgi:glutamyl-Q tRNA(Asp) synthetase